MSLRINNNIAAFNAHRQLSMTDAMLTKSIERLSSGFRINHAKDDVAGLSIANSFRLEARGLRVAQQNVSQATALLQMAEGGANQIETIIERLKELATSAASGNVDSNGRARLNDEAAQLLQEIDRIANDTKYGDSYLINGATTSLTYQIGSGNTAAEDRITVTLQDGLLTSDLGLNSITLTSQANAQTALASINAALSTVNVVMGNIGAAQSRLEFAGNNLAVSVENITASESTIRDADMAFEMVGFTRNQIMMQAGTAMLAQANMMPQVVLQLFG
ncbi:MAG: flagellin [Deltaproteobacteria bacterium]|nr:flagellin [Deltaproteobacteria bacterium]MBW2071769.1 flagellin [Deltaproteobacteria bacterium]